MGWILTYSCKLVRIGRIVYANHVFRLVSLRKDKVPSILSKKVSCTASIPVHGHKCHTGFDTPFSANLGNWIYVAVPVTRDQIVTRSYYTSDQNGSSDPTPAASPQTRKSIEYDGCRVPTRPSRVPRPLVRSVHSILYRAMQIC